MRRWRSEDFDHYAAYYADPATARFVGGQMDAPAAWRHMAALEGHWALRGFGVWAVDELSSGKFVGAIGLWQPEGWPELEVGYWLMTEHHGKGYANEAVIASRDFAYGELAARTLVSYIDPANEPSKRVAERVGAWHDETIDLCGLGPHCVYRHPSPKHA